MLSKLCHLVYLERRRLGFVTTLAFMSGVLLYSNVPVEVYGMPVSLLTGLIYAGVVGPAALLTILFLPALRFMIEAVAVSRLMMAIGVFHFPEFGMKIVASPMITALIVVTGGAIISRMIHGRMLREDVTTTSLRDKIIPRRLFQRTPPLLAATQWQTRYVGWVDGARPAIA